MALKVSRHGRRKMPRIPKARRLDVRREEYNRLIDMLNERAELFNRLLQDQQQILQDQRIQFQRISQLQVEFDLLKQAWARLKLAV